MTGKELKEFALRVDDDDEILVEVEDSPEGANLRRKFVIHGFHARPVTEEAKP